MGKKESKKEGNSYREWGGICPDYQQGTVFISLGLKFFISVGHKYWCEIKLPWAASSF